MSKDQRITEHITENCDKKQQGRETQIGDSAGSLVASETSCITTCPETLTTMLMNWKRTLLIILRCLNLELYCL